MEICLVKVLKNKIKQKFLEKNYSKKIIPKAVFNTQIKLFSYLYFNLTTVRSAANKNMH